MYIDQLFIHIWTSAASSNIKRPLVIKYLRFDSRVLPLCAFFSLFLLFFFFFSFVHWDHRLETPVRTLVGVSVLQFDKNASSLLLFNHVVWSHWNTSMSCCWLKALIISFSYSLLLIGNWMIKMSLGIMLSAVQMVQNKLKWSFKANFLSVLLLLFRWPGDLCLFLLWVNRESADEATGPDSGSRWSRVINSLWFTGKSEGHTAAHTSASRNCPSQDNWPNRLVEGEMLRWKSSKKWLFQRSCHTTIHTTIIHTAVPIFQQIQDIFWGNREQIVYSPKSSRKFLLISLLLLMNDCTSAPPV